MAKVEALLLAMGRVIGFYAVLPFPLPWFVKGGLAVAMALGLSARGGSGVFSPLAFLREVALGLLLGLSFGAALKAFLSMGSLKDFQSGFTLFSQMGGSFGEPSGPMQGLFLLLFSLVFFGAGVDRALAKALVASCDLLPLGGSFFVPRRAVRDLALKAGDWLVAGVSMAFVFSVVLVAVDVAFSFVARTVPQVSALLILLPVRAFLAVLLLVLFLDPLLRVLRAAGLSMAGATLELARAVSGGR